MEISELTLKLILVLIPGAIASRIYQKVTIHEKWTNFQFVSNSILFGALSYLLILLLNYITDYFDGINLFWSNLPTKEIPGETILHACVSAILIGFSVSAIDHYKLLNLLAKSLRISRKYGDENLYSYFVNSPDVTEIYIRDRSNGFTYHGFIDSYSENESTYEIVLRNVAVYAYEDSSHQFDLNKLYISKSKNDIVIEVPYKSTEL